MADKNLSCKDCGKEFVFTDGEATFYSEKGFPDPVRCGDCRKAKKDAKKNGQTNERSR